MNSYKTRVGSARIFNKALQSALGSNSSQKDHIIRKERRLSSESETSSVIHCLNTDMPITNEILAPSILNLQQEGINDNENSFQPKNIQNIPSDIPTWVENNILAAIEETLQTVPDNETDQWIKNKRLETLMHLRSCKVSSIASNSSSYTTESNDEMSSIASDDHVSSQSSGNLLLSKNNSLKSVSVSETEYESEKNDSFVSRHQVEIRPVFGQQKCFERNSRFQSNVKPLYESDKKKQFVCKSSTPLNQKLYEVKESCSSDIQVNLEFPTKSRNCCEPRANDRNKVAKLPSYNVSSLMNLKSATGFLDAHCHIDLLFNEENFNDTYADYIAQHKDSYPDSYSGCIAVFCKPWTFANVNLWRKHLEQDNVWGAFGCHPKQAKFYNTHVERHLEYALDHPKVRALGEIGLDYSKGNKRSKDKQHFIFRRQLKIAQRRNLRVVIHCREADDDAIEIMHEILPKNAIFHLHCFTGSWRKAQKWIEEFPNVYIGITNLVTFPSAIETHEVARRLPLKRLLLETDAPYFVPRQAPRGTKFSHPGLAIHVAAQIAAFKNIPVDEVLQATYANTRFVYNIS